MTTSTWRRANTIPTPTISTRWARTGSRAEREKIPMSRTGPKELLSGAVSTRRGFTLIELIVVLFALVILAAAVIPSLRGAGRENDLDDVTARVIASARYARETAAARGVSVDLTLDATAGMIRLVQEQETTSGSPFSSGPSAGDRKSTRLNSS